MRTELSAFLETFVQSSQTSCRNVCYVWHTMRCRTHDTTLFRVLACIDTSIEHVSHVSLMANRLKLKLPVTTNTLADQSMAVDTYCYFWGSENGITAWTFSGSCSRSTHYSRYNKDNHVCGYHQDPWRFAHSMGTDWLHYCWQYTSIYVERVSRLP